MCRVSVVTCLICQKPRTREALTFGKATRLQSINSKRSFTIKEYNCGYWFCKFMQDRQIENYRHRIGLTCGDQLCEKDRCQLRNVKIDCCITRVHVYRYFVPLVKPKILFPHTLNDYLTPQLSLSRLADRLHTSLTCSDYETMVLGAPVLIGDERYDIRVSGDVKKDLLYVRVARKDGERHPLQFVASFHRCVALACLK